MQRVPSISLWLALLPSLWLFHGCGGQGAPPVPFGGPSGASSSGGTGSSGGTVSGSSGGANASSGAPGSSAGGSGGASGGGSGGASGSSGGSASSGSGSGSASSSGGGGADGGSGGGTGCGAGDTKLPPEPTIPTACTTLLAAQAVSGSTLPSESNLDTARIQAALDSCAGGAVRLAPSGANGAFVTGPLTLRAGVTLWIDAGATLYASRTQSLYGASCGSNGASCTPLINATGAGTGVVGDGVIDGQGGEAMNGQSQSWWDLTASGVGADNPCLVQATSSATNFKLYRITLHNSPKIHVKLNAPGFVVWGVTIKTPSSPANSQGKSLTPTNALNTDGINPHGPAANGFIVCSTISDGDDNVAIKGPTPIHDLTIAHNHFGWGHGMSIGSETNGGVSNIDVYDLSIDGTGSGMSGGSSNGLRIKSDSSVGGLVSNVTYTDVCVRGLSNPIVFSPRYSSATGMLIPQYTGITIRDFHALAGSNVPTVTLLGFDASHITGVTLDNVVVDGIGGVKATYASVTLGPGNVNFTPSGTGVTVTNTITGTSQPNPCTGKWVTF